MQQLSVLGLFLVACSSGGSGGTSSAEICPSPGQGQMTLQITAVEGNANAPFASGSYDCTRGHQAAINRFVKYEGAVDDRVEVWLDLGENDYAPGQKSPNPYGIPDPGTFDLRFWVSHPEGRQDWSTETGTLTTTADGQAAKLEGHFEGIRVKCERNCGPAWIEVSGTFWAHPR